jgi:hypothetical protein
MLSAYLKWMSWNAFLKKNYEKIMQLGIDLKELNCVRIGNGESFAHQLVKFMICHHLLALKHRFKTEQQIGSAICDIIDLDTFIIYEIESSVSPFFVRKKLEDFYHPIIEDIFIVDIKKLKHLSSAFKLRKEIADYCGLS